MLSPPVTGRIADSCGASSDGVVTNCVAVPVNVMMYWHTDLLYAIVDITLVVGAPGRTGRRVSHDAEIGMYELLAPSQTVQPLVFASELVRTSRVPTASTTLAAVRCA